MADQPDYSQYLPTPEEYATPAQLKFARDYAQSLMTGNQQQGTTRPITHWSQGLSNVVNAIMGGDQSHQTDQQEYLAKLLGNRALSTTGPYAPPDAPGAPISPAAPGSPPPLPMAGPSSFTGATPTEDTPAPAPPNPFPNGVPIPAPRPDSAPASFDQRFPAPGMGMQNYTMPGSDKPGPSSSLDDPNNPGAPNAIALALQRGKPPNPLGAPASSPSVDANGFPIYIDPATLPKRPHVSRGQLEAIMGNDLISPEVKKATYENFMHQGDPITVPYMGGNVNISPLTGRQQYIPAVTTKEWKANGTEVPVTTTIGIRPDGSPVQRIVPFEGGTPGAPQPGAPAGTPNGPAPISGAPKSNPMGFPTIDDAKALKFTEESPTAPTQPPPPGMLGATPPGAPDSTGNIMPVGGKPIAAPANGVDPAALPPNSTPDTGTAPEGIPTPTQTATGTSNTQVAQSILPPQVQDFIDQAQARQLRFENQKDLNAESAKSFSKHYENWADAGEKTKALHDQISAAQQAVADPRFRSGWTGPFEKVIAQLKARFGDDPTAAAPMEAFEKLISGTILNQMRETLSGLGQVRVAEIDLLSKAAASLTNTPEGNKIVLALMQRANDRIDMLSKAATAYAMGYRLTSDGKDWERGTDPNNRAGLSYTLKRLSDNFETLDPETKAKYEKVIQAQGIDPAKYKAEKAAWDKATNPQSSQQTTPQPVAPTGAPAAPIRRPAPRPGMVPVNPMSQQ